jgi:hypothetical protein
VNGGSSVQWRPDGKELFYIAPDNRLMAVPVRLAPDRPAVESDAPIPLFATRFGGAWQAPLGREYVVSTVYTFRTSWRPSPAGLPPRRRLIE